MSEQRQRDDLSDALLRQQAGGGDADAGARADRLAAARGELDQLHAAADAILDGIRFGSSTRFLEQVRQRGGE